ncbi:hypothetical protein ACFQ9X_08885 [Catenulispora yoronensis]
MSVRRSEAQSHVGVEVDSRTGLRSCPTPAGVNSHTRAGLCPSVSTVIRLVLQAMVGWTMSQPPFTGPSEMTFLTSFQLVWL